MTDTREIAEVSEERLRELADYFDRTDIADRELLKRGLRQA